MRTGRGCRDCRSAADRGFTIIELVVAITLLGLVMTFAAQLLYGGMRALTAATQRSNFLELANGEVEAVRALQWDAVGVLTTDPDYSGGGSIYETTGTPRKHDGRDAVAVEPDDFTPAVRALVTDAVTVVTTSAVAGLPVPYTVTRWVTWDSAPGGPANAFKRLDLRLEWTENDRSARKINLSSKIYPGGLGTLSSNQLPTAVMSFSPATCVATGSPVSFSSAGSFDPDGDPLSYSWSFGDLGLEYTANPTHSYAIAGNYAVQLSVVDSEAGVGTTGGSVSVANPPGVAPTINPTGTSSTGEAPHTVVVQDGAFDPDSGLSYDWDWGDASVHATTGPATHTYNTPGTYTMGLTVNEDGCRSTTWTSPNPVTVLPLQCRFTSGRFQQKGNSLFNDLKVRADGTVANSDKDLDLQVVANTACAGPVAIHLPRVGGEVILSLSTFTDNGLVRTFTRNNASVSGEVFNKANDQQASVWHPVPSGAAQIYFDMDVHL